MHRRLLVAMFLLAGCTVTPPHGDCVARPTSELWAACLAQSCAACECLSTQGNTGGHASPYVASLTSALEKGRECQADLAVSLLPTLSGGDLEDVTRALGEMADHWPENFLRVVKRQHLDQRRIQRIVRMLPLSVVDDDAGRLRAVRERASALSRVDDASLLEVRDIAVRGLNQYEEELARRVDADKK